MKILADENIPFAEALFSELGEVVLKPGRHLEHRDLEGVDALLVRSVTKVNAALLAGHQVRFVGTCTIGTDHLDLPWLAQQGIAVSSAPGCNALGVVQYVLCALAHTGRLRPDATVAVIGCGNVGGQVYRYLKALGMDVVGVDPHLTTAQIPDLVSLDEALGRDVICMHTPRIRDGAHPTENLLSTAQFERMRPGALLLNAGRGECIDNPALLNYLRTHDDLEVVLDVWADEPNMMPELYQHCVIGTPHIAGYSYEGKVNGTTMIFEALTRFLGRDTDWIHQVLSGLRREAFGEPEACGPMGFYAGLQHSYDIVADHRRLGAVLDDLPASFDQLRKTYPKRREIAHYHFDAIAEDRALWGTDPFAAVGCKK